MGLARVDEAVFRRDSTVRRFHPETAYSRSQPPPILSFFHSSLFANFSMRRLMPRPVYSIPRNHHLFDRLVYFLPICFLAFERGFSGAEKQVLGQVRSREKITFVMQHYSSLCNRHIKFTRKITFTVFWEKKIKLFLTRENLECFQSLVAPWADALCPSPQPLKRNFGYFVLCFQIVRIGFGFTTLYSSSKKCM